MSLIIYLFGVPLIMATSMNGDCFIERAVDLTVLAIHGHDKTPIITEAVKFVGLTNVEMTMSNGSIGNIRKMSANLIKGSSALAKYPADRPTTTPNKAAIAADRNATKSVG